MKKVYFAPQTEIVLVCTESLLTIVSNTSAEELKLMAGTLTLMNECDISAVFIMESVKKTSGKEEGFVFYRK